MLYTTALLDMSSQQAHVTRMADRAWVPVLVDPAHISSDKLDVHVTWSRSLLIRYSYNAAFDTHG